MFVGDDDDHVWALGKVIEQSDVDEAEVVCNDHVVAIFMGGVAGDGDAGGELEEEVNEEEDNIADHIGEGL